MNNKLEIKVPKNTSIAVIGDIHEHSEQFFKLIDKLEPNSKLWLVSVGDLINKGFGIKAFEDVTDAIKDLSKKEIGFITQGNHELKEIREHKKSNKDLSKQLKWLSKQPLSISFTFDNGTLLTVLHAGVSPLHTQKDLEGGNTEVCYVRSVDPKTGDYIKLITTEDKDGNKIKKFASKGINWHEEYDGRFGYIASGHNAQHDGVPKFFKYSCNLDTACYSTGILTAQIFDSGGLRELIQVKGKAATPGKRYWNPED